MDKEVAKLLKNYSSEDEDLIKKHKFDALQKTVTFVVDLIEEEVEVTVAEINPGIYHIVQGRKITDVKSDSLLTVLKQLLSKFEAQRDELLEKYQGDTPVSPSQNENQFGADEDIIELDEEEEEESGNLTRDGAVVCQYFGSSTCSVVRSLDNVRINVVPEGLSSDVAQKYNIEKNDLFILALQFAPDYILNKKPPTVQYKPEQNTKSLGFGEQIANVAHCFISDRWKEMHPNSQIENWIADTDEADDKLAFIKDLMQTKNKKEISVIVKDLIDNNQHRLAKAYALYFCNMNPEKASQMYVDAGGSLDVNVANFELSRVNFLLELVAYLTIRIPFLTENCCICDHRIRIPLTQHTPTICTRFKCQFDFVELGICSSIPITINPSTVVNDIQQNYHIVDVLINLCYAAATSSRRELIFEPFPHFLCENKKNDYERIVKILDRVPSVSAMKKKGSTESKLKQFLDEEVYLLIKWILTVNRPALVKMPDKKKIPQMNTDHQYMMLVDSPEKTANFKLMRKECGSYFAFHGSSMENWHSILRRGLLNASNTKLMTTGAAYGPGIYLAPDSATSLNYARVGTRWPKSDFGEYNLQCLAIVEVIKHPEVPQTPNPYYVVKDPQFVTPRFFLFYTGASVRVMAKDLPLHKYIQ
jgi:hypothetical protein